jgi:hypothetical protein
MHVAFGRRTNGGVEPRLLDKVDVLQHLLDIRPTGYAQQKFAARTGESDAGAGFVRQ